MVERRLNKQDFIVPPICIAFLVIGCWMLSQSAAEIIANGGGTHPLVRMVMSRPVLHKSISLLMVLGAGYGLLRSILHIFDKSPALSANARGLTDAHYDSKEALGPIPWRDILGFSVTGSDNKRSLVVELVDLEKYLQAGNVNRRFNSEKNMESHGSPIVVGQQWIKSDLDEVLLQCQHLQALYTKPSNPVP